MCLLHYVCLFKRHFVLDKDYCATNNTCPTNSTCTSIPGTIACSCDTGFIGNQTLCEGTIHTL